MGQSTDAMLMYGYHLGGDDAGWEVEETDEYGALDASQIPWVLDEEHEEGTDFDLVEEAGALLMASVGFTETDWRAEGYYDREKAAKAELGVTIKTHCSGVTPMYVLAAHCVTARRGHVDEIDFEALSREVAEKAADAKLAAALQALGITPKQDNPRWLLCSYWG